MKNKIRISMLLLVLTAFFMSNTAYAKGNEETVNESPINIYSEENKAEKDELKPATSDKDIIPYQEVPKIPSDINPVATKENKARGTVIENVNKDGVDITPKPKNELINKEFKEETGSKEIDLRQFLTFETKSGKTFHLIVDHGKNSQNVRLLTEVGEQDLLNMIEGEKKPQNQEVVKKEEPKKEEVQKEEPKKEKSSTGSYVVVGLIMAVALGAGYYFKIVKPKQEDVFEEESESDDDYFTEETTEEVKEKVDETENIEDDEEEDE